VIPSPPNYWEDFASIQVKNIFSASDKIQLSNSPESHLRLLMDDLIDNFFYTDTSDYQTTEDFWRLMGAVAVASGMIGKTESEVTTILINKQRDYGPENIARFGIKGLIVRLHDKVARLENLLSSGRVASNEPIEDTFLDIVGYSAIALMWLDDQFLQPLRNDCDEMEVNSSSPTNEVSYTVEVV